MSICCHVIVDAGASSCTILQENGQLVIDGEDVGVLEVELFVKPVNVDDGKTVVAALARPKAVNSEIQRIDILRNHRYCQLQRPRSVLRGREVPPRRRTNDGPGSKS